MKKLKLIVLLILSIAFGFMDCAYYKINIERNRLITSGDSSSLLNIFAIQEDNLFHTFNEKGDHLKLSKLVENKEEVAAVPVMNYFNVQYYGSIYVGSLYQEMTVIFDTGSNILWVGSETCTNCRNFTSKFSSNTSVSFKNLQIPNNITYALGYVNGTTVQDNVYISKQLLSTNQQTGPNFKFSMGVQNFKFLLVDDEKYLDSTIADGVLGLGIDFEGDINNSFIYMLFKQGQITSPFFSFYLSDSKQGSRLYLGDIRENTNLNYLFDKINYCSVNNISSYWLCQGDNLNLIPHGMYDLESPNYNKTSSITALDLKSKVIFDTGTSYLIIPANDFIFLLPNFINSAVDGKCGITPYMQFICKCNSPKDFDDIEIHFGGSKLIIDSENLIEYYPTLKFQCRFEILIDIVMMDAWILGDTVLRNSLITFDIDQRKIGWIQNIDKVSDSLILNQTVVQSGYNNVESNKGDNYTWYILVGVLVLCFSYLIFRAANSLAIRSSQSPQQVSQVPLNAQ